MSAQPIPERRLTGSAASPGIASGVVWRFDQAPPPAPGGGGPVPAGRRQAECDTAASALATAGRALSDLAAGLPDEEAEIVETGALMAQDPALLGAVQAAIRDDGLTAAAAIIRATDRHAEAIAALGSPMLAARADDVRSLGRRAAAAATGRLQIRPDGTELILIAADLGPADVAELAPALAGIALAGGGATAHAAIVARSLGIPMVTGMDAAALRIPPGARVVIDGSAGELVLDPSARGVAMAQREMAGRRRAADRAHELRDQPSVTTDGTRVGVLANVASPEELAAGLRAGAEGIGLLRTELAFLEATDWPSQQAHSEALAPVLAGLGGHPAVVRVLDFGADKSPPFLHHVAQRGLELLMAHPEAFVHQLHAIVQAAQRYDVRIMLPMVETPGQIEASRALVEHVRAALGARRRPPLGAMIETPGAVQNAAAIAARSDFLSIGTNDLTASVLGADRFSASGACAHDPRVLRAIAHAVAVAHEAGLKIEVCGEAASDPIMLPLLVGVGVDDVSVGAARVGQVRDWIRRLSARDVAGLARSALTMDSAEEVEWAARPLVAELLVEARDGGHQRLDRSSGIVALGT